jgi:hypothetical protein
VSIHLVDIEQTTHTCPADLTPHVIDSRRTLVHIIDGGSCRNPITVHSGTATVTIPCGRHEPADRHCGACRTIVVERTITTRHLGYQGPEHLNPAAQVAA